MELSKLIAQTKPREDAGSRTSKQYDYQKDLSLYMLISHHEIADDYIFIFDYHDDLVILDAEAAPTSIEFFQVKSKHNGNWTLPALTQKAKDERFSILGKLYQNKLTFKEHVKTINVVSNSPFNFKLADNKTTILKYKISCTELTTSDVSSIKEQIKKEHSLTDDPDFQSILHFIRSKLSLDDSAAHCSGTLSKLFHKLNPSYNSNIELAYQKIFNEIRIRSATIIADAEETNWNIIKEKKGLSKRQFDEILQIAGLYKSFETTWEEIHPQLTSNGMGFMEVKKLKATWRTVNATLLSENNNIRLNQATATIDKIIDELKAENVLSQSQLLSLIILIYGRCNHLVAPPFDENFIKALILRQLYND